MIDLENELTRHLRRTAQAAEPVPDLSSVLDATRRPTATRSDRSRLAAVAAAVLLVVGVGGLIELNRHRSPSASEQPAPSVVTTVVTGPSPADPTASAPAPSAPAPSAPAPSSPTSSVPEIPAAPLLFPVLKDPQPEDGTLTATISHSEGTPTSSVIFGRRLDGGWTDLVTVTVSWEPNPLRALPSVEQVTVLDQPAYSFDGDSPGGSVEWGSGPYFTAEAMVTVAPLDFLQSLPAGAITASTPSDRSQPPELKVNAIPPGFEIIKAPEPAGTEPEKSTWATLSMQSIDFHVSTEIEWFPFPGGEMHPTEIGGIPGWVTAESWTTPFVAWQVNESTYAFAISKGLSRDETLAMVNRLTFVDFETWRAQYPNLTDNEGQPVTTLE